MELNEIMGERLNFATAPDGVRIAWRDDGDPGAPAVLLCSMGTAAMSVWDPIVPALAPRWRLIRHDRRGDGESDPGAPASHSFQGYARDALMVLDAAGGSAAHVTGMAFGARVAAALAMLAPSRVNRLMLFDATGGPPAPEPLRREMSRKAAVLRAEAGRPKAFFDPRWFERRDPAGAGLSRHAFAGLPDWTPGLETIAAPTLVACGDHDPNLEGARRMAREIPGAVFRLMPMTGHASLLDDPGQTAELIREFLDAA
ncbi:alpha/beta hydrolase [Phenylobacterium sp.]|uniref:alpha/beta fold hydrolase n=1 Tax=Phenylobacterium sp. TaxID=1871053 RepID=UPI002F402305